MLSLFLVCLSFNPHADSPAELVDRVRGTDPKVREEAEGLIEELGPAALPSLRVALAETDQLSQIQRLADLIDLIERKRLLRATKIDLAEQGTTISDAVADLSRRARIRVVLDPINDPLWTSKRTDYSSHGPIRFWEAIDRLGEGGDFRLDATSFWYGLRNEPTVRLVRSTNPPIPTTYVGPYRIDLVSLNRHRQVTQARAGVPPKLHDEFMAALNVIAEPGIVIERNGLPRVLEARNDNGLILSPSSTVDSSDRLGMSFRGWRTDSLSVITYKLPIGLPASRGGVLKRFRGTLPIIALLRTGPIISIPLEASEAKTFRGGGVSLTVQKIERVGNKIGTMQIRVQGERAKLSPGVATGFRHLTVGSLAPGFHPDDHIQILDSQGRSFQINSNVPTARPDGAFEFQVRLSNQIPLTSPTMLRYYGIVGEAIELPFDFADVPMP